MESLSALGVFRYFLGIHSVQERAEDRIINIDDTLGVLTPTEIPLSRHRAVKSHSACRTTSPLSSAITSA
jgi:hypothetical protein